MFFIKIFLLVDVLISAEAYRERNLIIHSAASNSTDKAAAVFGTYSKILLWAETNDMSCK